ncbi:MAG: hypothetical protein LBG48_00650 [Rickettsiales bacterium]|jgi:hypothetical protein|nr:hypothetical protein [Rickettsiales bacterium]
MDEPKKSITGLALERQDSFSILPTASNLPDTPATRDVPVVQRTDAEADTNKPKPNATGEGKAEPDTPVPVEPATTESNTKVTAEAAKKEDRSVQTEEYATGIEDEMELVSQMPIPEKDYDVLPLGRETNKIMKEREIDDLSEFLQEEDKTDQGSQDSDFLISFGLDGLVEYIERESLNFNELAKIKKDISSRLNGGEKVLQRLVMEKNEGENSLRVAKQFVVVKNGGEREVLCEYSSGVVKPKENKEIDSLRVAFSMNSDSMDGMLKFKEDEETHRLPCFSEFRDNPQKQNDLTYRLEVECKFLMTLKKLQRVSAQTAKGEDIKIKKENIRNTILEDTEEGMREVTKKILDEITRETEGAEPQRIIRLSAEKEEAIFYELRNLRLLLPSDRTKRKETKRKLVELNAEEKDIVDKINAAIRGHKDRELTKLYARLESIKIKEYVFLAQLSSREILKADKEMDTSRSGLIAHGHGITTTPAIVRYIKKTQKIEDKGNGTKVKGSGVLCRINGRPAVSIERKSLAKKIVDFASVSAELFSSRKKELEKELKDAREEREICLRECSDDSIKKLANSRLDMVENKVNLMEEWEKISHMKNIFNIYMAQSKEQNMGTDGKGSLVKSYAETLSTGGVELLKNREDDNDYLEDAFEVLAESLERQEQYYRKKDIAEKENIKKRVEILKKQMERLRKYVEILSRKENGFFKSRGTSVTGLYDLFNREHGEKDAILSYNDITGGKEVGEASRLGFRYPLFLDLVGAEGTEKYREILELARRKITDRFTKTQKELNDIFGRIQSRSEMAFRQNEKDIVSIKKTKQEREREKKMQEAERRGGMEHGYYS